MTREELLNRCTRIMGDTSDNAKDIIRESLDDCMQEFWYLHDWNWRVVQDSFATDGSTTYDLSSDASNFDDIEDMYNTANKQYVTRTEVTTLHAEDPAQATSGVPTKFAFVGDKTIKFNRTATSGLTMNYTYVKEYTPCNSDNDDLETDCGIPTKHHRAFIDGVLARAMPYMGSYDKAQYHLQMWDRTKAQAVANHEEHYAYSPRWTYDI